MGSILANENNIEKEQTLSCVLFLEKVICTYVYSISIYFNNPQTAIGMLP